MTSTASSASQAILDLCQRYDIRIKDVIEYPEGIALHAQIGGQDVSAFGACADELEDHLRDIGRTAQHHAAMEQVS